MHKEMHQTVFKWMTYSPNFYHFKVNPQNTIFPHCTLNACQREQWEIRASSRFICNVWGCCWTRWSLLYKAAAKQHLSSISLNTVYETMRRQRWRSQLTLSRWAILTNEKTDCRGSYLVETISKPLTSVWISHTSYVLRCTCFCHRHDSKLCVSCQNTMSSN